MRSIFNSLKYTLLLTLPLALCANATAADTGAKKPAFATIGKEVVSWDDYRAEFDKQARNKFYHGQPADQVMAEFQRTVGNKLVTDALIVNEANRRKLKPDAEEVAQQLKDYEQRYANDPQWAKARDRVLPAVTKHFNDASLIKRMEATIRQQVPQPTDAQLQDYYKAHPDKFTAPREQRVSTILLAVDPSSTSDAWKETTEDANGLIKKIREEGADFAEMAKLYSKDELTVDQGGDMGYLHDGMLPGLPQEIVDKLQVGEISEPVRLLQGVAIFKLTDRKQPAPSDFSSVKQRASELWFSEQRDLAWNKFLSDTKKKTAIQVDESRFLPLSNNLPSKGNKSQ